MPILTLKSITSPDLPIPGAEPWFANPDDPAIAVTESNEGEPRRLRGLLSGANVRRLLAR
jgi:hypothetical protein